LSLNGILSSALSALQVNQAALGTVSNNVANINTAGYVRRVVNEQAQVAGTQLTGVDIADIQRVADQFLNQEVLYAQAGSSQYGAQNDVYTQLNGILGQPGDGTALTSKLDDVFTALSSSALSPSSSASRQGALTAFQSLANTISTLSSSVSNLQTQVDQQVSASIGGINTAIKQIYTLNQQVQTATATGDAASGLLDQRDQALSQLSQLIGLRTAEGPNGQLIVSTQDGVTLVGDTYAQLSYQGGATNGTYGSIMLNNVNPATGQTFGQAMTLDPHLGSGKLEGLIGMRDGALSDIQQELGAFARQTADAFNAQHNANSAYPPPTTMNGRDTGLVSSDGLNFSGKTTIAVADSSGNLVSRIDVDFSAGTLSVDGGPASSIGTSVGSVVTALNSALGANGTASFSNGALSIAATGANGVVVQDDATTPSNRGGTGFSQFFGLNDLFSTGTPSILSTGLSAGDAGGFASGGAMSFTLKGPDGQVAKTVSVPVAATDTIGNVVSSLNTAFGGTMTFALASDGSLTAIPSSNYSNYKLNVTGDTTERGSTGMSFTELFGLGVTQAGAAASGFSVNPALATSPSLLAFGQPSITASTVAGQSIVTPGDARGLQALENVSSTRQTFAKAGAIAAQNSTLGDYAAAFYQDVAVRSQTASANNTTQTDRLTEAQTRQSSVSGVNLDEELTNMMSYQQAYAAGARILQTVQSLYDSLLQLQ
jgi:flagellar hook-associated protein 1 FlgK